MILLINQNFSVLQVFFHSNKLVKPDLVFSIGNSSLPPNSTFLAESQYRKARSVKNSKHAIQLLEETQNLQKEAVDRHQEMVKLYKKNQEEQI